MYLQTVSTVLFIVMDVVYVQVMCVHYLLKCTVTPDLSDAGLSDAGLSDADLSDAGLSDAGLSDAGLSDAGLSRNLICLTHCQCESPSLNCTQFHHTWFI